MHTRSTRAREAAGGLKRLQGGEKKGWGGGKGEDGEEAGPDDTACRPGLITITCGKADHPTRGGFVSIRTK